MARRPAKPKSVAGWQINRIGKVARYIGKVQALDAEAAIRLAIQEVRHRARAAKQDRGASDRLEQAG